MKKIDLNADLGEGAGSDEALLDIISSASIACGGHAGDENIMRKTLRLAKQRGVICGAHPGFIDKENFGRKRLNLPFSEIQNQIKIQLNSIQKIADAEGVQLRYVKLHGALANMTAEDFGLAKAAFETVKKHDAELAILALDNSAQVRAAKTLGQDIILEAYADRAYDENGLLVSRTIEGAVINDENKVVAQCLRLAQQGEIICLNGSVIKSQATSICLHGDNVSAIKLAQKIKIALQKAGIKIHSSL